MKKTVVFVAMMFTSTAALADVEMQKAAALHRLGIEIYSAFKQDPVTKAWIPKDGDAKCAKTIAELANLGVPGTTKVTMAQDSAELLAGEHTIDDLLPICERVKAFSKVWNFDRVLYSAYEEYPKVAAKKPFNEKHFENCIKEYDAMIKTGIPPTYPIAKQMIYDEATGNQIEYGGLTVEEMRKKWCDGGLKNAKAEIEKRDGPYKKALKGDKLSTALLWRSVWIAGGKATSDPAVMAKANVWFTDVYPGLICLKKGAPEVHELTRWEFDAASKLVRTSSTKYCGDPPTSAFK